MARRVPPWLSVALLVLAFAGCSQVEQQARRPAWRRQAEEACMARSPVHLSRYVQPRGGAINGPGICGLDHPYVVGALSQDRVQLDSVATLDCPMVAALDEWVATVVQPVAQARFGQAVAQIDTMGSYSCRGMNGQAGAKISEHAFGNALDIAGFRLADGRRITVVRDWTRGEAQDQAFLRDVHAGACNTFTTVLGPGSNAFHYNHIHVDLAMHGSGSRGLRRVCKPIPETSRPGPDQTGLPEAPPPQGDEEQDVAAAPPPPVHGGDRGPSVAAPPVYAGAGMPTRSSYAPEGSASDWDVTSSIRRH